MEKLREYGLNNFYMEFIVLIIFLIFLVQNYFLEKSFIFSPWMITLSVWSFILITFIFYGETLDTVNDTFLISVFLWVGGFFISSKLTYLFIQGNTNLSFNANTKIVNLFYIISLITSPFYLYFIYQQIATKGTGSLFFDIRSTAGDLSEELGVLIYVRSLNRVLFLYELAKFESKRKLRLWYIVMLNVVFALAIMEKGALIFLILSSLFILYYKKKITQKTIVTTFLTIIGLSFLFNTLRWAEGSEGYDFMVFFSMYVLAPSLAFQTLDITSVAADFGANTFPFFYAISNAIFGTNFNVEPKLQEFVNVPVPTNVYTIMQPFYEDFGYLGVFIFAIITGFITTYIFKKINSGHPFFISFYAFLVVILFLQFFQEELFVSLSITLQYLILLILPYVFGKFKFK